MTRCAIAQDTELNQNLNHKFWLILTPGARSGALLFPPSIAATVVVKGEHLGWVSIEAEL
jgi:hypothetical protein